MPRGTGRRGMGPRGGSRGLWVAPGLGRCDMNLGDQIVGGSGDQREELTSGAVLAVESPSRTDGVAALVV